MFKRYIQYLKDNPQGYWFKGSPFGWGWVPVKWQGWIVTIISVTSISTGIYIGERNDSPGMMLLGILVGALFTFGFGYKKGEKACWRWGFPAHHSTDVSESLYQCPVCKLHYKDKVWAKKCEAWCREHDSCNIAITTHAEETKKP